MTKVHPNGRTLVSTADVNGGSSTTTATTSMASKSSDGNCRSLTVWKKSLLLNCNGFTVFDSKGNLAFRVDKYGSAGEIVLMDASGKPLLTIRRKRFSISENWLVYDGESSSNHVLSVRKRVSLFSNTTSCLAHVMNRGTLVYKIYGSYTKRCCSIYDCNRQFVAEIRRKEVPPVDGVAFGFDVFKLVIVNPDLIDGSIAMAIVILLDEMFGSSS